MRDKSGKKIQIPDLKQATLMPLWQVLQTAMDKQAATLPLVIATQALLLSVVRVNGESRCKRLQITVRTAFSRALEQLRADLAAFSRGAEMGCPNQQNVKRNIEVLLSWTEFADSRLNKAPWTDQSSPELIPLSARQRDISLLQNPWVAGQQLLVLSLGAGIGIGSTALDTVGQVSVLLHLQNALRVVGAALPVPLVDETLMSALAAENKAIWFAGVPSSNFLKAWYHRMGMSSSVRTNRKLVRIEPVELSAAYKVAAEADLSGLSLSESVNPLPIVLAAIGAAFEADMLVGFNLTALGTKLLELPDRLIDALGLQAELQQELAHVIYDVAQNSGRRAGKRGGKGRGSGASGPDEKTRRAAVLKTLTGTLLGLCERDVPDKSEPLHLGPDSKKQTRNTVGEFRGRGDLAPCSPIERGVLDHAGVALKQYIESIPSPSYRIV